MNKTLLVAYARLVAVEARTLDKDVADKLAAFDKHAIKAILENQIKQLESSSTSIDLFSEEFRKSQAAAVREVLNDIGNILG